MPRMAASHDVPSDIAPLLAAMAGGVLVTKEATADVVAFVGLMARLWELPTAAQPRLPFRADAAWRGED